MIIWRNDKRFVIRGMKVEYYYNNPYYFSKEFQEDVSLEDKIRITVEEYNKKKDLPRSQQRNQFHIGNGPV